MFDSIIEDAEEVPIKDFLIKLKRREKNGLQKIWLLIEENLIKAISGDNLIFKILHWFQEKNYR